MKKILTTIALTLAIATVFGQTKVSIFSITSPQAIGYNLDQEAVTVVLENRGAAIVRNITLKLYHDDYTNPVATEVVDSVNVYAGAANTGRTIFTFPNLLDLSAPGEHKVKIVIDLDGNAPDNAQGFYGEKEVVVTNNVIVPPFIEGFEETADSSLPKTWTLVNNGKSKWTTSGNILAVQVGGPGGVQSSHSGKRYAGILSNSGGNDATLLTPGVKLTKDVLYSISFYAVARGTNAGNEKFTVNLSNDKGLDTMIFADTTGIDKTPNYQYVTVRFTPKETTFYQLGFRYFSEAEEGFYAAIDDIAITEMQNTDLVISASFPNFVQIPVNQFPTNHYAKVRNEGLNPVTNVKLSGELNGKNLKTSEGVDIAVGELSEELNMYSRRPIVAGENTITYTVQGDQENQGARNSVSFTFTGSENEYAMDATESFTNGVGTSTGADFTLGNIFEIFHTATLTQYRVGFGAKDATPYFFEIYRLNSDPSASTMTVDTIPVLKLRGDRMGTGWSDVPLFGNERVVLTPGRYYVAIHQVSTVNISVGFDRNLERAMYAKYGNILRRDGQWGALAIRLTLSGGFEEWCKGDNDPACDEVVDPNAIEELQAYKPNIMIYPNPVKDVLRYQTDEKVLRVDIHNTNGVLVKRVVGQYEEIPVNELSQGVYAIRFFTEKGVSGQVFVKK